MCPNSNMLPTEPQLLVFNGIDGTTGQYLVPPLAPANLVAAALGERLPQAYVNELQNKTPGKLGLPFDIDNSDLAKTGWGVIFPADADPNQMAAIREALQPLLTYRAQQAGDRYREYFDPADAYRRDQNRFEWLTKHGMSPGTTVDPDKIPYYLLIVGDPQSIPYTFQHELDVDYAVGRIHFDTLEEYAQYAASVVAAERDGKVARPRQAAFFAVTNPGDRATQLSTVHLIDPLWEKIAEKTKDQWQLGDGPIAGDDANKARLLQLLGGDETPALLFTASHGLGYRNGEKEQLAFQGALVCSDWKGPYSGGITRDHYLAAEDIADSANLLGLMTFHFACYGAGTPYEDAFWQRLNRLPTPIAPYSFLAALPKRLLSHPRGGALAVVGHVERAWTYSFDWRAATEQTTTFENALRLLMKGERIGYALEHLNLRYASIATELSNMVEDAYRGRKPDPNRLAELWTANNDARGFAIIGDPAARLPLAAADAQPKAPEPIVVSSQVKGPVPAVLDPQSMPQTGSPSPGAAAPSTAPLVQTPHLGTVALTGDAMAFGEAGNELGVALGNFTRRLAAFVDEVTSLDIVTYVADSLDTVTYDQDSKKFQGGNAQPRAMTRISATGDTRTVVPLTGGQLDETVWGIHGEAVRLAQANRAELIRIATEILKGFWSKVG